MEKERQKLADEPTSSSEKIDLRDLQKSTKGESKKRVEIALPRISYDDPEDFHPRAFPSDIKESPQSDNEAHLERRGAAGDAVAEGRRKSRQERISEIIRITTPKESKWKRVMCWRIPFSPVPPLPWLIPALLFAAAAVVMYIKDRNQHMLTRDIWRWLALAAISIAAVPLGSFAVGLLITSFNAIFRDAKLFYFVSALDWPLVVLVWTISFRVTYRYLLEEPYETETFGEAVDFLAKLIWVMASITCVSVIIEKYIIIHLNRSAYWLKIKDSIEQETILQKLYKTAMRKASIAGDLSSNEVLQKLNMGSSTSVMASAVRSKPLRKKATRGVLLSHFENLTPDFDTYAQLHQLIQETPKLALNDTEEKLCENKQEAEAVARQVFSRLDSQSKGYLDIADFYDALTAKYVNRAFKLFDTSASGRVTEQQTIDTVQKIYQQRKILARTVSDRDNLAAILSKAFRGVLLIITLVVVLILLNVQVTVFLPFATFALAFSFAFGNSLRQLWEALLMEKSKVIIDYLYKEYFIEEKVFFVRPFEQGDRIDLDGTAYDIQRIHLLSTVAKTTDGKSIVFPNSLLVATKIINITRSGPYVLNFPLHVEIATKAETIEKIIDGAKGFLNANPRFNRDGYKIWVDDLQKQNNWLLIKIWAPLTKIKWADGGMYLDCRNDFILFLKKMLDVLEVKYSLPTQPVMLEQNAARAEPNHLRDYVPPREDE